MADQDRSRQYMYYIYKKFSIEKNIQIKLIFNPIAVESSVVASVVFGGSVGCKLNTVDTVDTVDAVDTVDDV